MFSIYIVITKGQRPAFKNYITNGEDSTIISQLFLSSQLQCFQLYRAFFETDDKIVCESIAQSSTFRNKKMKAEEKLTPVDLECMTLFQNCLSQKAWVAMNLSGCFIQDIGVAILHRGLINSGIVIESMNLSDNGITQSTSSLISKIAIACKVKELQLNGNRTIGEEENFYKMVYDPLSALEILHISRTNLTNNGAIKCFKALSKGKLLKELWVSYNSITDDASDVICSALRENKSLIRLRIRKNKTTGDFAREIINAVLSHENLEELWLPKYTYEIQKEIQDILNKNRESKGNFTTLEIKFYN